MIYFGLKLYLRTNLLKPSVNFIWTQEENYKLFEYLNDKYSAEYLAKSRNESEIKQAFKDFFEPVGYILFRIKKSKINLKILPYKIEPKDSKDLILLINMVREYEDLIRFDYKGKEDQILIKGKLRRNLYHYVYEINKEHINKKELIRHVIKKAIELENKDVILVRKREIFIKLFKEVKRREVVGENSSLLNRYNGYTEEDFTELYSKYFEDINVLSHFLKMVSEEVFTNLFINKKITNNYYEKNIFPIIQNRIAEELLEFTDNNLEFRKGFAGYIFRINFLIIFTDISNALLELLHRKDEYIMNWIDYYNGQVFVDDGTRYISPELLTKENQKWNPRTIYAKVSLWFKTKQNIDLFNKRLEDLEKEIEPFIIDNKTPWEYKKILLDEQINAKRIVNDFESEINNKVEDRYLVKDKKELLVISRDVDQLRKGLISHKSTLETIVFNLNNFNEKQKKYKIIDEEKRKILKDVKYEQRVLESNFDSFSAIKEAIIKALISKRKIL